MLLDLKNRWKIKITLVASALAVILLLIGAGVFLSQKTFYKGVTVEGIEISGLNMAQARLLVESRINERYGEQKISLKNEDKIWELRFSDISYRFRTDDALQKAYTKGRTGNIFKRLYEIAGLRFEKFIVDSEAEYDVERLAEILAKIKAQTDCEAKDASILYKDGKLTFNKEIIGSALDIDINKKIIENYILERQFDNIELFVEKESPEILYKDISEIKDCISIFSTTFDVKNVNRSFNIKLACDKLNGTVIPVKGTFSMDKKLGPRTIENGYKEAPVIYKNELVPGSGGGVCQVTTTLYDAVLKAKLDVLQREHHSMPLGYVEPGQDATIAEGSIDFQFQNNGEYPVCVFAQVSGSRLNIRIFGKSKNDGCIVKLKSQIIEEYITDEEEFVIDDSIPDGEKVVVREAKRGLKVIVYRDTYSKTGERLEREKISVDTYNPVKAQVKVNSNYNKTLFNMEE